MPLHYSALPGIRISSAPEFVLSHQIMKYEFEPILRPCSTALLLMVEFGDNFSNRFGSSIAARHPLKFCCQHCDVTYSDMFLLES